MANAEGITPSRHEVERQLERMLADPLFLARPKQAAIFEYLVKRTLDGAELSEKTIFAEFFTDKRYAEATTNVRTTVSHIRTQLLKQYYGGDGQYDPILISLPSPERSTARKKDYKLIRRPDGKAYTPSFAYNPASWMARELTVAHHLLRGSPAQLDRAMEQLGIAGRAEPDHPEVMLGTVEAWAMKLVIGALGGPEEAFVTRPLVYLEQIEKEIGPTWRTHYVRALLHFFMRDMKAAAREFEKALTLNRGQTVSRGGYVDFLFRTGRQEQALRLMAMEAEDQAGNAPVHAFYAIHLARMRRYEDAERVFAKSLLLDPNGWTAHFGLWEMYLVQGNLTQAEKHARFLETLLAPDEFDLLRRKLNLDPNSER